MKYHLRRLCGGAIIAAYLTGSLLRAAGTAATSSVISVGATYDEVVAKLGTPQGVMKHARSMTLYYDRGMIDFKDGRVVKAKIMPSEEALRLKLAREQDWEKLRLTAEANRKRLTEVGRNELQIKLEDKGFSRQSPSERLKFWYEFSKRFPYTDVSAFIAEAEAAELGQRRIHEYREESNTILMRIEEIKSRFLQLDADYAASLTHWKRNEIDAERKKLNQEVAELQNRLIAIDTEIKKYTAPAAPATPAK